TLLATRQGECELLITIDNGGMITGFYIYDVTKIFVPSRNSIPLRLPFEGEWTVIEGGETEARNYHGSVGSRSQRRAVDFSLSDDSGHWCSGDGKKNEDYYAYGKEVLAPADGTVVTVIDGVPDNRPLSTNPYTSTGNTVILRLRPSEFSVFAHLKYQSIKVKVGDKVKAGQTFARCGNSGNSSKPHLHFHLMNTEVPGDATGFAPFFQNVHVMRNGQKNQEKEYMPIRGDRIQQLQ
ncbi:MAG: M23 family metallopeptidase, partial [Planctomycetia bacterium]|nr:M23 family metallopeptidase [Planctomycetia bacterium]